MAATLVLILYVALPDRAYYTTVGAILGKLYANSILVLLNSRMWIAGSRQPSGHFREPSSARSIPSTRSRANRAKATLVSFGRRTPTRTSLGGVRVEEQVWVHTDQMDMGGQVGKAGSILDFAKLTITCAVCRCLRQRSLS